MIKIPELTLINKCKESNPWDLTNKILYDLCKSNSEHDTDDKILAKTLLIGRSYSVALERRKTKQVTDISDDFYLNTIVNCFKESDLDNKIATLPELTKIDEANLPMCLNTHWYLTDILLKITHLYKRSFSSKYLHFHLPNLFYIYDSRAVDALSMFISKVPKQLEQFIHKDQVDKDYAKFFCKCFHLQQLIATEYGVSLSPRQLDNILLEVSNQKAIRKHSYLSHQP